MLPNRQTLPSLKRSRCASAGLAVSTAPANAAGAVVRERCRRLPHEVEPRVARQDQSSKRRVDLEQDHVDGECPARARARARSRPMSAERLERVVGAMHHRRDSSGQDQIRLVDDHLTDRQVDRIAANWRFEEPIDLAWRSG